MNVLGHLACAAHLPLPAQAGALLPDLLGLHGRRLKALPLVRRWQGAGQPIAEAEPLVLGITQHHEVDAHFHRAPLFAHCAQRLRERLAQASATPGLKRLLPAHVLTEMYLDHLLLEDSPEWAGRFDAVLGEQRELLSRFAALHPAVRAEDFAALLQRLVAGRFVAAYRTPQGIMERMQRILARLGQRALEPAEQAAAWNELEGQAALLRERLHGFVAWAARGFSGGAQSRRHEAPAEELPTDGSPTEVAAGPPFFSGPAGSGPENLHPLGRLAGLGAPLAVMES